MASYSYDFPFGIMDVVELLHLNVRRRLPDSVYVDCPFCGDRRGKMNVNKVKDISTHSFVITNKLVTITTMRLKSAKSHLLNILRLPFKLETST